VPAFLFESTTGTSEEELEEEEEEEELEPDESDEATAEAGLTETGVQPDEDVEFEDGQPQVGAPLVPVPASVSGRPLSEFPLTWMADAFRQNGLRVREARGWKTRGRPRNFSPRAVLFHNTASNRHSSASPALGVVLKGRLLPDGTFQSGPLCNVLVGRDGVVHLVAAGRASHAGGGGPWRNIPADSGNKYMIGVEVENDGVGEPWSKELLEVCDVVFATLLMGLRRRPKFLAGHKEWAPRRKSDPARIDMDQYRHRVDRRMRAIRLARDRKEQRKPPSKRATAPSVYVVKAGDTLFRIARRHGMSVPELKKLNALKDDLVHPGDRLKSRRKDS
jgi:LysM repeat protein